MKSKLVRLILVLGVISIAAGIFILVQKITRSLAEKSLEAAKVDPKQCSFEETRPYNTEYRYVIPPDNKWYAARMSALAGKRFSLKVDRGYDYAHTNWIFQDYPRSDQNGVLQVNHGVIETIDWKTVNPGRNIPKQVSLVVKKSGQISFRYKGEGCLVVLTQMF